MIVLGIILLVLGYVLPMPLLTTLGWILVVIGVVLFILARSAAQSPVDEFGSDRKAAAWSAHSRHIGLAQQPLIELGIL